MGWQGTGTYQAKPEPSPFAVPATRTGRVGFTIPFWNIKRWNPAKEKNPLNSAFVCGNCPLPPDIQGEAAQPAKAQTPNQCPPEPVKPLQNQPLIDVGRPFNRPPTTTPIRNFMVCYWMQLVTEFYSLFFFLFLQRMKIKKIRIHFLRFQFLLFGEETTSIREACP